MNVTQILRTYLGLSQVELADRVGITQPDLSEIETLPPYGKTAKYQRLSGYLGVTLEALVKNDFTAIPASFFDKHPAPVYTPAPEDTIHLIGRQGEDFILERERNRLVEKWPALSKLVMPFYKMRGTFPGYDILSFDDEGKPVCLEVKTSQGEGNNFRMTRNELDTAKKLTGQGERYTVVCIGNWGKEEPKVCDILFSELESGYNIVPNYYVCTPKTQKKEHINGLTYFRLQRGLRQSDVAKKLEVGLSNYNLYECGHVVPNIAFFIRASQFYGTTIDNLLAVYDPPAC